MFKWGQSSSFRALMLRAPDDGTGSGGDTGGGAGGDPPVVPAEGGSAADTGAAGGTGAGNDPVGGTGDELGANGEGTPTPVEPAPRTVPIERLNQTVAERWAERRRAEGAEEALRLANETIAQLSTVPQVGADGQPVPRTQAPAKPAVTPQELQRMAGEIAEQNSFNEKVRNSIAEGQKSYPDFDAVASRLQAYGELPRPFVEALLESGKGHDVLYNLAQNPLDADRILSMKSPVAMAVAVTKYADTVKPKPVAKVTTSAPAPITPKVGNGGGKTTPSIDDPNISTKEWMALRDKQVKEQKAGGRR